MASAGKVQEKSPEPITKDIVGEGEKPSFIPYPKIGDKLEHVPIHVRPDLLYYVSRMGFLPYTIKLYLHVPWIAEFLFKLNNAVMRDERNGLSEHLKYRLSMVASRDNECTYCTAHHALTFRRRWSYSDSDIEHLLKMDQPGDEREAVAMEFVHQTSLDAAGVTDELRQRLAKHFTPQECMEIVLVAGFWKMYNIMHTAMGMPLEDPVVPDAHWVGVGPSQ